MREAKQRAMGLLGIVRGCKERRVLNVCKHLCIFIFLERARSLCFFLFGFLSHICIAVQIDGYKWRFSYYFLFKI